jgi:hypothetical protein
MVGWRIHDESTFAAVHDVATQPRTMTKGRIAATTAEPPDQDTARTETVARWTVSRTAFGPDDHPSLLDGHQPLAPWLRHRVPAYVHPPTNANRRS